LPNEVLFRLRGTPIYRGSLVVYQPDPDLPQKVEGAPCIVLDFEWDDDSRMHLVRVLMDGEVRLCLRSDLEPV
jgi:hypothetical protein